MLNLIFLGFSSIFNIKHVDHALCYLNGIFKEKFTYFVTLSSLNKKTIQKHTIIKAWLYYKSQQISYVFFLCSDISIVKYKLFI